MHIHRGDIKIRWVPRHASIAGNEAADCAANEGCRTTLAHQLPFSHAGIRRWARLSNYERLEILRSSCRPKELSITRSTLAHILAARTAHGDFADYHVRFHHDDAYLNCRCGHRKAPLHFIFCNIAKRRARRPLGPPSEVIPYLLGTFQGGLELEKWLTKTRFFIDICPNKITAR